MEITQLHLYSFSFMYHMVTDGDWINRIFIQKICLLFDLVSYRTTHFLFSLSICNSPIGTRQESLISLFCWPQKLFLELFFSYFFSSLWSYPETKTADVSRAIKIVELFLDPELLSTLQKVRSFILKLAVFIYLLKIWFTESKRLRE